MHPLRGAIALPGQGHGQLDAAPEAATGARLRRRGSDAAIITWGTMVKPTLDAAEQLAARGVSASVLDLRWLRPLDRAAIADVIAETGGAVIVVHEANLTGGFGAEVAAHIQATHFDELDAPIARIGCPDVRIPAAPALQAALVPGVDDIVESCLAVVGATA